MFQKKETTKKFTSRNKHFTFKNTYKSNLRKNRYYNRLTYNEIEDTRRKQRLLKNNKITETNINLLKIYLNLRDINDLQRLIVEELLKSELWEYVDSKLLYSYCIGLIKFDQVENDLMKNVLVELENKAIDFIEYNDTICRIILENNQTSLNFI